MAEILQDTFPMHREEISGPTQHTKAVTATPNAQKHDVVILKTVLFTVQLHPKPLVTGPVCT